MSSNKYGHNENDFSDATKASNCFIDECEEWNYNMGLEKHWHGVWGGRETDRQRDIHTVKNLSLIHI